MPTFALLEQLLEVAFAFVGHLVQGSGEFQIVRRSRHASARVDTLPHAVHRIVVCGCVHKSPHRQRCDRENTDSGLGALRTSGTIRQINSRRNSRITDFV